MKCKYTIKINTNETREYGINTGNRIAAGRIRNRTERTTK